MDSKFEDKRETSELDLSNASAPPGMRRMSERVSALEEICGIKFKDHSAAEDILAFGPKCYKYEQTGDIALGLVVHHSRSMKLAGLMVEELPLSNLSNTYLAARCSQTRIAALIDTPHTIFNPSNNKGVLSDSLESIIGLAYVEGGYTNACKLIAKVFDTTVPQLAPISEQTKALAEKPIGKIADSVLDSIHNDTAPPQNMIVEAVHSYLKKETRPDALEKLGHLSRFVGRAFLLAQISTANLPDIGTGRSTSPSLMLSRGFYLNPGLGNHKKHREAFNLGIGAVLMTYGAEEAARVLDVSEIKTTKLSSSKDHRAQR